MKNILFIFLSLAAAGLRAQNTSATENVYLNEQEYTVYSSDYKEARNRLEAFIKANNYTVIKQEESKTSHYYEFNVPVAAEHTVDSLAGTFGYISNKQLTAFNNEEKLEAAKIDLAAQENKKQAYESMLLRIDSVGSAKYYQHWEKIREIEAEIARIAKRLHQLEKISPLYRVKLRINDEQVNPANTRVSFVNMPGVHYSVLFTENPLAGRSYGMYQGIFLKYLFTKGKSYFALGVLKASGQNQSDSLSRSASNEIFNLVFGQDFYSKRFGRGSKRWLNLYVGYQVGASMYFTDNSATTVPFANPGIGLELFKNKYVLIDSNVYYFLPLSDSYNRHARGWMPGVSFNFVF